MVREFKYCENPNAEVPRMFIDKEIGGKDSDGNHNIDGSLFLKELMFLSDVMGKGTIEVWINSPGGIVTEGQSIYAAILESKANVNTICYGIAASIAGVIFQAGKKRIMLDFTHLMYHPAYSEDGRVDKGLEALNNSICKMIAKRTGKSEDEIWAIMNRGRMDDKGTWIIAEEAEKMGFCDEVRHSDAKNSLESESMQAIWKNANKIYNRQTEQPKIKKMKNVLNKLGLIEDANEASAIAAIDALNKKNEDLEARLNKAKEVYDALNSEMEEMKKKAKADEDEAKAKADEDAKNKKKMEDEDKAKNAETKITKAVTEGKIKNDAAVIAKYKASYLANPELTEELIEALPINRTSPKFVQNDDVIKIEDSPAETAARKNGLKPGTGAWYNFVKANTVVTKK